MCCSNHGMCCSGLCKLMITPKEENPQGLWVPAEREKLVSPEYLDGNFFNYTRVHVLYIYIYIYIYTHHHVHYSLIN